MDERPRTSNGNTEKRLNRLERAIFGFRDDDNNEWIDGLLQQGADTKRTLLIAVKIGLPFMIVGSISMAAQTIHNGAWGALWGWATSLLR